MLARTTILWTLYAAVFGFAAGASLFSSYPPPQNHQTTIDDRQTGAKNATAEIASPKSADDRIADYTWWVAAFTCALVVISAVQIHFLLRSDETARIAANAAKKSADVAEKTLVIGNRAWLAIEDVKLVHPTKFTEDGFVFRLTATAKHHGETPATSVWINYESYFSEGNEVPFTAAQERFRSALRKHWGQMGETLFKGDTFTTRLLWADGPDKIKKAITIRPDGERRFNFTIFVGVSYRIIGEPRAHITQYAYGMLNVPVGMEISEGKEIELSRVPFLAGEVD